MQRIFFYTLLALVGSAIVGCGAQAANEEATSGLPSPITEESTKFTPLCVTNPCCSASGAALPLGPADIAVAGTGPFDMVSTAFVSERGEITAVYERYNDELLSGSQLETVTSSDCGRTFSAPQPLERGPAATYRTTPSAVKLAGHRYLYFTSAAAFDEVPAIWRSEYRYGQFGEPVEMGSIPGVGSLLSWPRFAEGPWGWGISVAFRTLPEKPSKLDWSLDGLHYVEFSTVDPGPTAMPRTAYFGDGTAVFTYQTFSDVDWSTWSWWRISAITDGQLTWTDPVLATTESNNVNDAAPFLRNDGDIDLYYIYSSLEPTDTFKLYRRCLTRQGVLGPEELVTNIGSPNKPNLARLPCGKTLLMYADITKVDSDGYPLEQILKAAVLAGDAPRP